MVREEILSPIGDDPTGGVGLAASGALIVPNAGIKTQAGTPLLLAGQQSQLGAAVAVLGDSLTSNGVEGALPAWNGRAWYYWGAATSGRRFYICNVAAAGSLTTTQIKDTMLPLILAGTSNFPGVAGSVKPAFCFVLGGTNDPGAGISAATTLANLILIYQSLLNAGITPIACTLTPRSDIPDTICLLNAGIVQLASQMNLPLADLWSAGVDPANGGWLSGYNADAIHMNAVGAKAVGVAVAAALNFLPVTLQATKYAPATGAFPNGLFNVDSNADGVPDGWDNIFGGAAATPALLAGETGITGKAWSMTIPGGSGGFIARTNVGLACAAGDWIAYDLKWSFAPAGTNPDAGLNVINQSNAGYIQTLYSTGNTYSMPSTGGYIDYHGVWKVPSGVTSLGLDSIAHGVGSVLKIAQLSMVNLTTAGLTVQ